MAQGITEMLQYHFYTQMLIFHGIGVLVIGFFFLTKSPVIEYIFTESQDTVSIICVFVGMLVIVLGSIIVMFSIKRYTAVFFDNNILLLGFILLYVVLVVHELYFGVILMFGIENEKARLLVNMKLDFKLQNVMRNVRSNSFHILEKVLRCCGIESSYDYKVFEKFPLTCCSTELPCYRGLDVYPGCLKDTIDELVFVYNISSLIYCSLAVFDILALAFLVHCLVQNLFPQPIDE